MYARRIIPAKREKECGPFCKIIWQTWTISTTAHSRVEWFLREKKMGTRQVVPNCYRTQIKNKFFCLRGRCPLYLEIFYTITQWSCSASGSSWEMPDFNPGPLPCPEVWWANNEPSHIWNIKIYQVKKNFDNFGSLKFFFFLEFSFWRLFFGVKKDFCKFRKHC